jgi:hypothetical protein
MSTGQCLVLLAGAGLCDLPKLRWDMLLPTRRGEWMPRYREEVINVELAKFLSSRGLEAHAETIERRSLPDVLIHLGGLKLVIEGRAASRPASLMADAERRISDGLADLSMAVLYPEGLNSADSMAALGKNIAGSRYSGAIFYYASRGIDSLEFADATLDELAEAIRTAFRVRVRNEVVREHVRRVEEAIETVVRYSAETTLFSSSTTLIKRLGKALGVAER